MIRQTIKQVEDTASEVYEARQAETRKLLKQIEADLEQHDRQASSLIGHHWGHVGDLMSIADTLTDLKDRLHLTGEYANVS
jgi:hypothetical protein